MSKKTVIITGGNNGIGKETARRLAEEGLRVILACRNMETGRQARDEIIQTTANKDVILKELDLSSFKSIREFAKIINGTESNLDILIHNAGVWLKDYQTSEDGIEMTMATNQFGPFLLTHLLIDLLKKSAPSRIVIVSSVAHYLGHLNLDEGEYRSSYFPASNYCNSKFANLCFTQELSRRLRNSNITVNAVHPGLIRTDIWNNKPFPLNWIIHLAGQMFFRSVVEGSETIVYVALSDKVSNKTGKYFVDCKEAFRSPMTFNNENNLRLWNHMEKIVKLHDDDPKLEFSFNNT